MNITVGHCCTDLGELKLKLEKDTQNPSFTFKETLSWKNNLLSQPEALHGATTRYLLCGLCYRKDKPKLCDFIIKLLLVLKDKKNKSSKDKHWVIQADYFNPVHGEHCLYRKLQPVVYQTPVEVTTNNDTCELSYDPLFEDQLFEETMRNLTDSLTETCNTSDSFGEVENTAVVVGRDSSVCDAAADVHSSRFDCSKQSCQKLLNFEVDTASFEPVGTKHDLSPLYYETQNQITPKKLTTNASGSSDDFLLENGLSISPDSVLYSSQSNHCSPTHVNNIVDCTANNNNTPSFCLINNMSREHSLLNPGSDLIYGGRFKIGQQLDPDKNAFYSSLPYRKDDFGCNPRTNKKNTKKNNTQPVTPNGLTLMSPFVDASLSPLPLSPYNGFAPNPFDTENFYLSAPSPPPLTPHKNNSFTTYNQFMLNLDGHDGVIPQLAIERESLIDKSKYHQQQATKYFCKTREIFYAVMKSSDPNLSSLQNAAALNEMQTSYQFSEYHRVSREQLLSVIKNSTNCSSLSSVDIASSGVDCTRSVSVEAVVGGQGGDDRDNDVGGDRSNPIGAIDGRPLYEEQLISACKYIDIYGNHQPWFNLNSGINYDISLLRRICVNYECCKCGLFCAALRLPFSDEDLRLCSKCHYNLCFSVVGKAALSEHLAHERQRGVAASVSDAELTIYYLRNCPLHNINNNNTASENNVFINFQKYFLNPEYLPICERQTRNYPVSSESEVKTHGIFPIGRESSRSDNWRTVIINPLFWSFEKVVGDFLNSQDCSIPIAKTIFHLRMFASGSALSDILSKKGFAHLIENTSNFLDLHSSNWLTYCISHSASFSSSLYCLKVLIEKILSLPNVIEKRINLIVCGVRRNNNKRVIKAPFVLNLRELLEAIVGNVEGVWGESSVRGFLFSCYEDTRDRLTIPPPMRNRQMAVAVNLLSVVCDEEEDRIDEADGRNLEMVEQ